MNTLDLIVVSLLVVTSLVAVVFFLSTARINPYRSQDDNERS